ncbi:hypothetical protein [Sphingobacterium lactis]|uniref:Uncharacterized protein n=1 Tax=Sphingobacterium lactis TaxID=797291 RepID=A0A1H5RQE0_9SPHI|nr:hypothetical protein [Sphingobacterium lactis]SEF40525.1 hypothetical protein SAMN05421877_10130 [Sphingobacterium lactis]
MLTKFILKFMVWFCAFLWSTMIPQLAILFPSEKTADGPKTDDSQKQEHSRAYPQETQEDTPC